MEDQSERKGSTKFTKEPWGWMVLGSIFILNGFIAMKILLFGVIHLEFFTSAQTSSTTIAWIINIFQFIMDTSSQFAGPLCDRFGFRIITFVCGLVIGTSSIISAVVTIPEILFVTYSLFQGAAVGILFVIAQCTLPLYFDRKLGFAIGVSNAGLSVGTIAGPNLFSLLRYAYGKYASVILSATYFNICAAAITLVRPRINSRKCTTPSPDEKVQVGEGSSVKGETPTKVTVNNENENSSSDINRIEQIVQDTPPTRNETVSELGHNNSTERVSVLREVLSNLKLLRHFRVLIIVCSISLLFVAHVNFMNFLPFALSNAGHPTELVTWSFSIIAICNFLSRLLIPSLSDYVAISKKWYILTGSFAAGSALVVFANVSTTPMILTATAIYGFSIGCTTTFQALVIIEFMGLHFLPATFGVNGFFNAILFLVLGPIIGIIRDHSGSYEVTILFISSLCFLSALLWILMPVALYLDRRKSLKESIPYEIKTS